MTSLEKKLKIVRSVFCYGIRYTHKVREMYQNGEIKLISSEWHDRFKSENPELYPLDLMNTDNWITFEDSADLTIKYNNRGGIDVDVFIHYGKNSSNLHMGRTKWQARFRFQPEHLKEFKDSIDWKFSTKLEELYDKELLAKKKKRMNEIGKELLREL